MNRREAGDRGASMVEYGLMVAFVAMVSLGVIGWVGSATGDSYDEVAVALGAEVADSGNGALAGQDDQSQAGGGGGQQESPDSTTPPPGNNEDTSGGPSDEANQYEAEDEETDSAPAEEEVAPPAEEPVEEPVEEIAPTPPTVTAQGAEYTKWEPRRNGNADGEWDATVTFQNDTELDQVLTLEVTTVDENGAKTTTTVEVTIAAGASADYAKTGNVVEIRGNGKNFKGVASVEVKLTSITTTDGNGQPVVTEVDQAATVIEAPEAP